MSLLEGSVPAIRDIRNHPIPGGPNIYPLETDDAISDISIPAASSAEINRDEIWRKRAIVAAKIAVVVIVVLLLVGGAVATAGAASGLAAVPMIASYKVGAVYGISIALGFSAKVALFNARWNKMFSYTGHDAKDCLKFIGIQILATTALSAMGAFIGSFMGLKLANLFGNRVIEVNYSNPYFNHGSYWADHIATGQWRDLINFNDVLVDPSLVPGYP